MSKLWVCEVRRPTKSHKEQKRSVGRSVEAKEISEAWKRVLVGTEALRGIAEGARIGKAAGTPFGGAEISGCPNPYTTCKVSSGSKLE